MTQKQNIGELLPPLPAAIGTGVDPVRTINPDWQRTEQGNGSLLYEGIVDIPKEFQDYTRILRFDSVGCEAKVCVDGVEFRKHSGSFTQWDCDITKASEGKESVRLSLLLTGKEGELSPYQMAGIFRGLLLVALPKSRISMLYAQTKQREHGPMQLHLEYSLKLDRDEAGYELEAILTDRDGAAVLDRKLELRNAGTANTDGTTGINGNSHNSDTVHAGGIVNTEGITGGIAHDISASVVFDCDNVALWDSENPNLYQLKLILTKDGRLVEEVTRHIGFRKLERRKDQVFWNDRPLKLRGICYREPLSHETERNMRKELMLLKGANINYIRGLFYPFSSELLNMCDTMGFYVEQSAAVCEVDQSINSTQNMPEYREAYLEQFRETLVRDRSHVSILLWSLGSDSTWGSNFREEYRLAKRLDDIRLINFHFPMSIPEEETQMDVWSVNYASHKLPLDVRYDQMVIFHTHGSNNEIGYATGSAPDYDMPVLHDAFAHVPCYNRDQIDRDPGIHEFWGESIKRFWDKMWDTEGCLGGAVMAAVDEDGTFSDKLKDHHWGILTADSRPKPEYYHVRMSYSPIKLAGIKLTQYGTMITLENRFNHTNLSEVELHWFYNGRHDIAVMNAASGEKTDILLPVTVHGMDTIRLKFYYRDMMIYEEQIIGEEMKPGEIVLEAAAQPDGKANQSLHEEAGKEAWNPYALSEDQDTLQLDNGRYFFAFSKDTKLMISARADGSQVLAGGPAIQTTRLKLEPWVGLDLAVNVTDTGAEAVITGEYGKVMKVRFTLHITMDGRLDTECRILSLFKPMPHTVKANIGIDCGGLDEMGIWYLLCPGYEHFRWNRKGLWSCYPQDHIGRTVGEAFRKDGDDFRSMKHFVLDAVVSNQDSRAAIEVLSDGSHSVRLEAVPDPDACIDDRDGRIDYHGIWYEMDDYCGNFMDTETLSSQKGDYLEFTFTGTGIRVYGPTDYNYGICDIYLDGKLAKEGISQYPAKVDFPGMSRGYEKRYQLCLYSVSGLDNTEHTLRIIVRGEKEAGAQNTYVSLDYMVVENPKYQDSIKLIVNNDYNYTRLVRGNYMRDKVELKSGDVLSNRLRFISLL